MRWPRLILFLPAGLLLGGCGSQPTAGPQSAVGASDSPVDGGTASPAPATRVSAPPIEPAKGPQRLDLSSINCIGPNTVAAMVFRPQRIAGSPLVARLMKVPGLPDWLDGRQRSTTLALVLAPARLRHGQAERIENLRKELLQIDFLLRVGNASDPARAKTEGYSTTVVRFATPVDGKRVLRRLLELMLAGFGLENHEPIVEKTIDGKACIATRSQRAGDTDFGYVADDRTLVLPDANITPGMLASRKPDGALADRLAQADIDHDMTLVVALPHDRERFRKELLKGVQEVPTPLRPLLETPDLLKAGTATLDLAGDTLLEVLMDGNSAQGAARLEKVAQDGLVAAKLGLAAVRKSLDGKRRETLSPGLALADQLLAGTRLVRTGDRVTLTVKRVAAMDDVLYRLIEAMMKEQPKSGPDASVPRFPAEGEEEDLDALGAKPPVPPPKQFSASQTKEFNSIVDRTLAMTAAEMPAYWLLVQAAREATFAQLRQHANKAPDFTELTREPANRRGQLMKIKLDVRRIQKLEMKTGDNKPHYEMWGFSDGSLTDLYAVIAVDLPDGIETGVSVRERLIVAGYFLRLQGYPPAEAKDSKEVRNAPVLIGRVERASRAAKKTPATQEKEE